MSLSQVQNFLRALSLRTSFRVTDVHRERLNSTHSLVKQYHAVVASTRLPLHVEALFVDSHNLRTNHEPRLDLIKAAGEHLSPLAVPLQFRQSRLPSWSARGSPRAPPTTLQQTHSSHIHRLVDTATNCAAQSTIVNADSLDRTGAPTYRTETSAARPTFRHCGRFRLP
jgi:hypothetical protein